MEILISLLPEYRRTFFVLDGLDELIRIDSQGVPANQFIVTILQKLLTQDHSNVSIATFWRPDLVTLNPLLDLADVSIRLSRVEPDPRRYEYITIKVQRIVKPAFIRAGRECDRESLDAIEQVLVEASDGL